MTGTVVKQKTEIISNRQESYFIQNYCKRGREASQLLLIQNVEVLRAGMGDLRPCVFVHWP